MKILFVFIAIILSSTVFAKTEPLRIALLGNAPFVWEEKGQYRGFHYDLADALSKKMGAKLELQLVPLKRMVDSLEKGTAEAVIFTDNKELDALNLKKERLATFIVSIYSKRTKKNPNAISDVKGLVARILGGCQEITDPSQIKWIEAQSYAQAYDLLKADRVEYVCGTIAFTRAIEQSGGSRDEVQAFEFSKKNLSIQALSTLDSKRWDAIQKAAKSLVAEGAPEQMRDRYAK